MLINFVTVDGEVLGMDLPEGFGYGELQSLLEAEVGIPADRQKLIKDGLELSSASYALCNNDVVYVMGNVINKPLQTKPSSSAEQRPREDKAKAGKVSEWKERVEDALNSAHINANMAAALEHHPEAFAPVSMLFVPMTVNGHSLNGFVDSGAQSTIISKACAERCHIGHLIDQRFSGIAKGVGTGKILGRIHAVVVSVGHQHLSCALTVIEGSIGPDVLFGLDMLKRHQVIIDFAQNSMIIHGETVQFLPEHQLPKFE